MHTQSRTKTHNQKMPFWGYTSRIRRQNHHPKRNSPARSQNHHFSSQNQISQIKETGPEICWIRKLLQKLYFPTVGNINRNV